MESVAEQWHKVTGCMVSEGYGMTEASPIISMNPLGYQKLGSAGLPVPGTEIKVVDEQGKEQPIGAVGELCVRGDQVMKGYWQRPEQTDETIVDGWLHTGDMARTDGDGLYWFADRLKHVIISGGENIYPAELERVLRDLPGLAVFAIVGRDDDRWGQVPVVVAVADGTPSSRSVDRAAVLAYFESRLARFKHPKDVLFVEALPRNVLGKVVAADVRALLTSG